jgi:hypothetical protein
MEKRLRISHTVHRDGSVETHIDGMLPPKTVDLVKVGKAAIRKAADKLYLDMLDNQTVKTKLKKVINKKMRLEKAS